MRQWKDWCARQRKDRPKARRAKAIRLRRMRRLWPVEHGNKTDAGLLAALYGENGERLPQRMQAALRRLVVQFATESDHTRRQEIRRIKQAHQFWRGLQYLWWSESDQNWHLPFEQKLADGSSLEDLPRYEFVTNIYQAFGLSIVSVLSQDVPGVRFFPASAQQEQDVCAAKAATEVAQLVERNNRIGNLIVEEAFHLWTGGKIGAYVRYVVDGQRFGFHPEMQLTARQVKLGTDAFKCAKCGAAVAAEWTGRRARGEMRRLLRLLQAALGPSLRSG